MIGILCNVKKEKAFSAHFHNLFKPLIRGKNIPIIVTCLPNINISEKTAFGSLISEDKITTVKTTLPSLIYNFAVQHTKSDVKKMRNLMEFEDIQIINPSNVYNQWSIMEMLLSNNKTKNYILPFMNYNKEDVFFDFTKVDNFLVKPENRSNLSRIIYGKQSDYGFDLYGIYGNQCCHRFDIQSAIYPIMHRGKWLLLNAPDLITYKNRLFIIRAYMQRRSDGEWSVLLKTIMPQGESIYDDLGKKIDAYSLQIINYVNCFISDIGIGFIDFVLDKHGTPYFLNFGGWDNKLLNKKHNKDACISLCKNILEYAEMFSCEKPDIY